jgi:hypothetical protein
VLINPTIQNRTRHFSGVYHYTRHIIFLPRNLLPGDKCSNIWHHVTVTPPLWWNKNMMNLSTKNNCLLQKSCKSYSTASSHFPHFWKLFMVETCATSKWLSLRQPESKYNDTCVYVSDDHSDVTCWDLKDKEDFFKQKLNKFKWSMKIHMLSHIINDLSKISKAKPLDSLRSIFPFMKKITISCIFFRDGAGLHSCYDNSVIGTYNFRW